AAGVHFDGTYFNDTDGALAWDAVWSVETTRDEQGWTAEFALPLDILRFDAASMARWRVYLQRYVSRRKELDEWPYMSRDQSALVSRFSPITGVQGLRPQRALYLIPYAAASVTYARRPPGDLTDLVGTDSRYKGGFDAKLALTPALSLDATANPDFAQIDADQLILNLTTFETFFAEKRQFFLEGGDLFTP